MVRFELSPTHDCLLNEDTLVSNGVSNRQSATRVRELCLNWVYLLTDSPSFSTSGPKPARVITKFVVEMATTPIRDLILRYSALADRLMCDPALFEQGSLTGPFLDELLHTPCAFEYIRWFRTGDPELLQWILSFLRYGKKLEYLDEELYQTAFRGWIETEERIKLVEFDDLETRDLKTIISVLIDFAPDGLHPLPKHGPGTVSDGRGTPYAKAHGFYDNPKLVKAFGSEVFRRVDGFIDWRSVAPSEATSVVHAKSLVKHAQPSTRAELLFAFKNVKTARTICREPTGTMWGQQLVLANLLRNWKTSPIGRYVDLWDQTHNQIAAQFGSETGAADTIDLSFASDSVSVRLVRKIFPRELLYYMLATRTSQVKLPDGSVYDVDKYAPMGSALCFPTQCIIFTAVCIQAYIEAWTTGTLGGCPGTAKPGGLKESFVHQFLDTVICSSYSVKNRVDKFQPIRVFGDDIVCDSRVTPIVIRLLQRYGFIVNSDKSFMGPQAFRESCGKYYWNGHDVTPLMFSRTFGSSSETPVSLASLIAHTNRVGDYGYRNLHSRLIHRCLNVEIGNRPRRYQGRFGKNGIPFTTRRESSFSLFSNRPVNAHLRKGWDIDLQRGLVRTIVPHQQVEGFRQAKRGKHYRNEEIDLVVEMQAYRLWWTAADSVVPKPTRNMWVKGGSVSWDTLLRWGWTPT